MKIAINLLPIELKVEQIKKAKFYKIQTIGIVAIMFVVFMASLTVALSILQNHNMAQIQKKITASEQKVSELKSTQASLLLLKNRLTTINQYFEIPSRQSQLYKLLTDSLPGSVSINSVSISKDDNIIVLAYAGNIKDVDSLITNLTSKDKNQDKVSKLSLESISRATDGSYNLSFNIKAK